MSLSVARRGLLSCAFAVTGCTTGQVLSGPDLVQIPAVVHVGDTVRTTSAAGATQEFELVALEDDGVLRGVTSAGASIAVQTDDVAALEYRRPAPRRTVWLVVGAVLGAGLISAHDSCKPEGPYGTPACAE